MAFKKKKNIGLKIINQLLTTEPYSNDFGFDRGQPIDRYYIEKFLYENREIITGDVLEIGDDTYTKKFGLNVKNSHILNFKSSFS